MEDDYEFNSRHSYNWDRDDSFFQWVPWGRIPLIVPPVQRPFILQHHNGTIRTLLRSYRISNRRIQINTKNRKRRIISSLLNKTEYRRRRRRGNWHNPVDAPLFYC